MAQWDNPKNAALLFVGAFLIGMGVIAFLNVEIQSRESHGTKIRNENLFEVLGKKICRTISTLRERNSYRRSVLYHIFVSDDNSTRIPARKLLYYLEKSDSLDETLERSYYNMSLHRLRHKKKIRRLTAIRHRQKPNATSVEIPKEVNSIDKDKSIGDDYVRRFGKNVQNDTVQWVRWSGNNTKNDTVGDILKERVGAHENCYTTNDVLEIIAITCLVNFIFWFLIISCVNMFTRNQKISKSDSCESLTSISTTSDLEVPPKKPKKTQEMPAESASFCRHSFVEDYVNSLATETNVLNDGHRPDTEPRGRGRANSTTESSNRYDSESVGRTKLSHLPNVLFDMITLNHLKPLQKNERNLHSRHINIVNSLSMENLMF